MAAVPDEAAKESMVVHVSWRVGGSGDVEDPVTVWGRWCEAIGLVGGDIQEARVAQEGVQFSVRVRSLVVEYG